MLMRKASFIQALKLKFFSCTIGEELIRLLNYVPRQISQNLSG